MKLNVAMLREARAFSPTWVSNGHWLIRRSVVGAWADVPPTHTDKKLASVITPLRKGWLVRCDIQPWLYAVPMGTNYARLFLDERGKCPVAIDEKYVRAFDLSAVWVSPPNLVTMNATTVAKATVFVLPMHIAAAGASLRRLHAALTRRRK